MFTKDLFVYLCGLGGIFTEWYLRRPDIKKPIVFLKRRSKQDPADLTFKEEWTHFQGAVFFGLFDDFGDFGVLG